jgi:hypothetical protein
MVVGLKVCGGQADGRGTNAQRLKEPIPPSEAKLAFTVKLPHRLVRRVRAFAVAKGLSISEVVLFEVPIGLTRRNGTVLRQLFDRVGELTATEQQVARAIEALDSLNLAGA